MRKILTLAQVALLPVALMVLTASAQTESAEPEPRPAGSGLVTVEIAPQGYVYEVDGDEPLVVIVQQRSVGFEGTWVDYLPLGRLIDGSFVPLTPCDDVAIRCAPLKTRASAAFEEAPVGAELTLFLDEN